LLRQILIKVIELFFIFSKRIFRIIFLDIIAALLASLTAAISILFYTGILNLLETNGHDRVHAARPANNSIVPVATPQIIVPPRQSHTNNQQNNHRPNPVVSAKKHEVVERATSPVDERILNEFYADRPKDVHQYHLEGRQYVVYEGANLTDIETYRKGKLIFLYQNKIVLFLFCIRINRSDVNTRISRSS